MQGDLHPNPHFRSALAIVRRLRDANHQAFFAGGCVRDLLLGLAPKDFDVATSATPGEIVALFPKSFTVGAHFGVVLVVSEQDESGAVCQSVTEEEKKNNVSGPREIATEVATFRNDGAYSDGRRPDAVRFSTDPREDVLRRDFTINGMLLDPLEYEATGDLTSATLDFVHGREDLAARIIRAIGDPSLRFAEDKLRMLRAVRFAARLNFQIDAATAIRRHAAEIALVSAERIRDELTRILTEGGARRGFELLFNLGLLAEVLPEAVRLRGVAQPPEFHPEGDVWTHTMLMLEKLGPASPSSLPSREASRTARSASREASSTARSARVPHPFAASSRKGGTQALEQPSSPAKPISPTLAWAALLHYIGKPATYQPPKPATLGSNEKPDRIRFNGHVEAGVRIAETILARLRFSGDDTAQILSLVANHMRFGDVLQMKQSTLKRFLRLPRFDEHLALHRLDAISAHGDLTCYDFARAHFEAEPTPDLRPAPLLTGRDLIAAGYRPSPQFKPMLALAEDAELEGSIATPRQALALVQAAYPLPSTSPSPAQRK
jgi:poly(A) polymerase